jgi:hypothetical protein
MAWFPEGYSLTVETMRRIAEYVHTECHMKGIHIPCESFEWQWHNMISRAINVIPLSVHQLHKEVWKSVEKLSKKDIVTEITEQNVNIK